MRVVSYITGLALIFTIAACSNGSSRVSTEPVARVFNKYLYPEDIAEVVGENMSATDSADVVNHYIEGWVRKNILLNKADELLPRNRAEIEAKLQDYRESLLLFLFEQELLTQNLDSIVNDREIEKYYNENKENFELRDDVLKASFIILKNESPQLETVKEWFTNGVEENKEALQDYCFQYAINFSLVPEWHTFESFTEEIPIDTDSPPEFLATHRFYQTRDAVNTYMVNVEEFGIKGKLAPLDYERQDIAKIIVNKRKMHYVNEMKDKIYREALEKNQYEIY